MSKFISIFFFCEFRKRIKLFAGVTINLFSFIVCHDEAQMEIYANENEYRISVFSLLATLVGLTVCVAAYIVWSYTHFGAPASRHFKSNSTHFGSSAPSQYVAIFTMDVWPSLRLPTISVAIGSAYLLIESI